MKRILSAVMVLGAVACGIGKASDKPQSSENWQSGSASNPKLDMAHQSYLNGDLQTMMSSIRETLVETKNDPAVVENVSNLMRKARAELNKDLPIDWTLPEAVSSLRFYHTTRQRGDNEYVYAVRLGADISHMGAVTQVQVTRYPDQVLIDKSAGIGEWDEEQDDGYVNISMNSEKRPEPYKGGLYLLNLITDDGQEMKGWFILENHVSSSVPSVRSPQVGEAYQSSQPSFNWVDFVSSEFQQGEFRRVALNLNQILDNDEWKFVWHFEGKDDLPTTAKVGEVGGPARNLENGRYVLSVNYREIHKFGPMRIGRESSKAIPFRVEAQ